MAPAGLRAATLEEHHVAARRLVGTLDITELQVLECLVRGMSEKDTTALTGIPAEDVKRARVSITQKLNARTTADVVRIGLYAGADLLA